MEMISLYRCDLYFFRHFQARLGCLDGIEEDIELGGKGTEGLDPVFELASVASERFH